MRTRFLTKHNDTASIAQSEEKLTNNYMYQVADNKGFKITSCAIIKALSRRRPGLST